MTNLLKDVAEAIDPQAFIGTEQEIHAYCSPRRVDFVQKEALDKAKAAIEKVAVWLEEKMDFTESEEASDALWVAVMQLRNQTKEAGDA